MDHLDPRISRIRASFSHQCNHRCDGDSHVFTIAEWEVFHGDGSTRPDTPVPEVSPRQFLNHLQPLSKIRDDQSTFTLQIRERQSRPTIVSSTPSKETQPLEHRSKPVIVSSPPPELLQPLPMRPRPRMTFIPPILLTPFEQKARTKDEIRRDQLLDDHGRQRAHELDWLQNLKRRIEKGTTDLQNWRVLKDCINPTPGKNHSVMISAETWTSGNTQQTSILNKLEQELRREIQKVTGRAHQLPVGWERTPIEERLRMLWRSLYDHCKDRYVTVEQSIMQRCPDKQTAGFRLR